MSIEHPEHDKYPESVILRKFNGQVGVDDIINSWLTLIKENRVTSEVKGVLNDIENCSLNMDMKDFQRLIHFMKQEEFVKTLKIAVVTNSPKDIVFPSLGEVQERELRIRPFSTIQAAVNWILE